MFNPKKFLFYIQTLCKKNALATQQPDFTKIRPTFYSLATTINKEASIKEILFLYSATSLIQLITLLTLSCYWSNILENIGETNLSQINLAKLQQVKQLAEIDTASIETDQNQRTIKKIKKILKDSAGLSKEENNQVLLFTAALHLHSRKTPHYSVHPTGSLSPALSESNFIALLLAKKTPQLLASMATTFTDNEKIMQRAVQTDPRTYHIASPRLKLTHSLLIQALQKQPIIIIKTYPCLQKNKKFKPFALRAVEIAPEAIRYMHKDLQNDWDIFLQALEVANHPRVIKWLPPHSPIRIEVESTIENHKSRKKKVSTKDIVKKYRELKASEPHSPHCASGPRF